MSCAAIIVAAGRSRRMGFDKLLSEIDGVPVLQRTLNAFLASELVERIVLVTPPERFERLELGDRKEVQRVEGGQERFLSVLSGLDAFEPAPVYIAIHDGARPLVRPEQIDQTFQVARETGACALAHRITDTVRTANSDDFTRSTVPRQGLWAMETPQTFRFKPLRRAFNQINTRAGVWTDDISVAEGIGLAAKLIENNHPNPKITVPADLLLAEALLRVEPESDPASTES